MAKKILKGKRRAQCSQCKARKYVKFLIRDKRAHSSSFGAWVCFNTDFCKKRSPNYRK